MEGGRYAKDGTDWEKGTDLFSGLNRRINRGQTTFIGYRPIRADMVEHSAEYRWSSYRANAQGESSALRGPHPLYQALGRDEVLRTEAYRELFRYQLDPGLVDQMRAATNGNYALGSPKFSAEVEAALGRRVIRGKPGRPKNTPDLQ